jgi:hypothetical protein
LKKRKFNNFAERTARQEISRICKELQKANKKKEDDTWFEDDPKASKEKDYGRVYHEPTIQPFTGGYSMLSDIMDKGGNNHLRYTAKHGSARDGVRYRYKKRQK